MDVMRNIWINCSEASGDLFAGALAAELLGQCPTLEIRGMGGPVLSRAGAELRFSMSRLCFTGFVDVLVGLPGVFRLRREILRAWEEDRPDAVVMVDCPDFNLPLARSACAMGIPVYYFMAPQFWAWRQHGINTLRECVCHTFCALPFEPDYFRNRGCLATYAGHPLLDIIPLDALDKLHPDREQIGIMPGSRKKEIAFLLPEFAEAAARLHKDNASLSFHIARAPGIEHDFLRRFWPAHLPVTIVEPEHRYRMIRRSSLVMTASGTATLEIALIGTPAIVAYKLDRPAAFVARKLACSKFMSLTNILFQKELFPEFLQEKANATSCYRQATTWLSDPDSRRRVRRSLQGIRTLAGPPKGLRAVAKTILRHDISQGDKR